MMSDLTIAAAQCGSIKDNIEQNITAHLQFIRMAGEHHAALIVFPELSLTGYEPEIAQEAALNRSEDILQPLILESNLQNITIVAGCPIRSDVEKPYIGAFIFQPYKPVSIYRKQYLHDGEERFFIPSKSFNARVIDIHTDERVAIAICADTSNPSHPAIAKAAQATIYAAGVLITPDGIDEANHRMANYAQKYGILTLMANYATPTGGYDSAGQSAIWRPNGDLLVQANANDQCLVLAKKSNGNWNSEIVRM
jgi:predicted amidohydrolase